MVSRVVDRRSGEVVRQVPPEEALKIAAYIRSYLQGLAARESAPPAESP
ncbi:MAG: flagellar protein FlaG [Chloroflexi bacterium]|nr:flagellar protein FlaG [Chloroflexota bacterium]